MEGQKQFLIGSSSEKTFVAVDSTLGVILRRPEVIEIAASYGSEVRGTFGFTSIDIIPPIPYEQLDKLGQALVQLALSLDPSDPKPTYEIS